LSEKFSVLKTLERKTKYPNMQALYITANNFARDESTAFGANDEADTSHVELSAGKKIYCTVCNIVNHISAGCFEPGGGRSHWTSAERKQFFDKKLERKDGRSEYRKRDRDEDDSEDSHSHPKTKRKMSKHYDSLIKNYRKNIANQASHIKALTSKRKKTQREREEDPSDPCGSSGPEPRVRRRV
jgi:hypothetical protein